MLRNIATSDNGPKNHVLAKQNCSSRQSRCVVTANCACTVARIRLVRRPPEELKPLQKFSNRVWPD